MPIIIYEITHPEGVGSNYIIPTVDVDSPSHQCALTDIITQSPVVRHAEKLITRTDELHHDLLKGLENRLNHIKDDALDLLETLDDNDDDWDELHADANINLDNQYPGFSLNGMRTSVSDGIKVYAHRNRLDVYPLEDRSTYLADIMHLTKHMAMKPKNIAKFVFFKATLPLSLPVNVFFSAKRESRKLRDNYNDYLEGNYQHMLRHAYDNSVKNDHFIAERVERWLEIGYDGDIQNPTSNGLVDYLHNYDNTVIALDASCVLYEGSGLLAELKNFGFEVIERDISYDPKLYTQNTSKCEL